MAKRYWLDSGSWPLKEHVELPLKAILFGVPFTEKNRETLSFVPFLPDFLPVTPACIAVGLQPRKVLYLVLAVASRPKNNFICPWRVRGALAGHVANISTSHRNGQGYIGTTQLTMQLSFSNGSVSAGPQAPALALQESAHARMGTDNRLACQPHRHCCHVISPARGSRRIEDRRWHLREVLQGGTHHRFV